MPAGALGLRLHDARRLARLGTLFRLILAVRWESESLEYEYLEMALANMELYEHFIADTVRILL
jgi:hypothetical protein